ncbi:glycosyltransferase family 4 protein [Chlorobium phaeobacteroides]|uniref:Glycosyl transferase, group 1 n=1 Tax=Chlorobium phaeobacteroides (strain DSM 266 / SMG 266 / 2430) TaxID=290317 RepID=A1BIT2_CHLPD|nr:glycosyltransferase family 4 protein [Chlorobium phaeobacteroides]ABL66309.1 glycosyl transferase, group 1 [Chlorobium phaeobacteroides DSM 266]
MNFLFVHQNFPGQFRHVAKALAEMPEHRVVGIGESANLKGRLSLHPRINVMGYQPKRGASPETHHYIRDFEGAVRRGQEVARVAFELRKKGFRPDLVISHPAWGESFFLPDIFPDARHIGYFEYFYRSSGGDIGFDPEFPSSFDDRLKVRIKNTTQLLSLDSADAGISPTLWQQSRYPKEFHSKIRVIHEGVDTNVVAPDENASIDIDGAHFIRGDRVITYVARNLEPCRGVHVFIRAIPLIQELCPDARIVIIGGDDVSYGRRPTAGTTYRSLYCDEVKDVADWSRVHFTGRLPYNRYLKILQLSSAHVYLTYPFVLSWSMLEAMAAGCVVIGSATPPVQEVITHAENGLLVDFFDREELARTVAGVVNNQSQHEQIRQSARQTILDRYDLHTKCLPELLRYLIG